jgi:hypothetical protein
MAYKYSVGKRDFGDIEYENDVDTQIDFENDFIALKAGGSQVLVVSGSEVGIGISSPTQNLHVVGSGNTTLRVQGSDGYYGALNVKGGTGDSAWLWQPANTSELRFFTVDDDRIVILGTGEVGIGTSAPKSGLHINSSLATALSVKSSDYTLTGADHTILVDCSNGNVTLTLPTAVGCVGRIYMIKRVDGTNNAANINSNGSEEIEGSTNPASVAALGSLTLQSDNSGWWKMAEYIAPP